MSDEVMSDAPRYLLIKRGLYYRPNNQGYTGKRSEAGRYPETDADDMSGITAVHEDNAAEYAPACWQETINQDLRARLNAAERERDALREALEAMIASRDANSVEREQYKEPCDGNEWHGYWSPHSSMIESRFVAAARAALTANHSAPVVEE